MKHCVCSIEIILWIMKCSSVELLEPPYWSSFSKPRLWLHTIISSKYFDLAIAIVIGVNVITMALEYYNMPRVSDISHSASFARTVRNRHATSLARCPLDCPQETGDYIGSD